MNNLQLDAFKKFIKIVSRESNLPSLLAMTAGVKTNHVRLNGLSETDTLT